MTAASTRSDTIVDSPQPRWERFAGALNNPDRPYGLALIYLFALTLAEIVTVMLVPQAGAMINFILLFMLMAHTAVTWQRPIHRFLLGLTFVPLIRVISLSLPLSGFPLIYWYLITSIPLFAAVYVASRQLGIPLINLRFRLRGLPLQLAIGSTGLFLGFIEYAILQPKPLVEGRFDWGLFWLGALILFFSTGYIEELIFRRVMQHTSTEALGRLLGIVYVSTLFAVLHIGYKSLADVIFVFLVGFAFGLIVLRTGSLLGVTIAHGLTNIVLFLIVPFLAIGELPLPEAGGAEWLAWAEETVSEIGLFPDQPPDRVHPVANATDSPVGIATEPGDSAPTLVVSATIATSSSTLTPQPTMKSQPTTGASETPIPTATTSATASPTRLPTTPTTGLQLDTIRVEVGQNVTTVFDELNLRLGPDTSYASLGFLQLGQSYEVTGRNDAGDWLLICCSQQTGLEGWVFAAYTTNYQAPGESTPNITETPTIVAPVAVAVVSVEQLAVRAGPAFDTLVIGEQPRDTSLNVTARTPDREWWFICCVDGASGWVYAKSVTLFGDPFDVPIFAETARDTASQLAAQPGALPVGQPPLCPPPAAADSGLLSAIGDFSQSLVEIVFPSDDPCRQ